MKSNLLITIVTAIALLLIASTDVKSQSDNYKWSIKFGGGISRMIPSGTTKDWYGIGKGPQIFAGIGFKSVHLNATFSYYDSEVKQDLEYQDYILPMNSTIRMVFFNVTFSYEQEIINRFFVEPYLGYLNNNITSNIIDSDGNDIEFENIYGMTLGFNVIKYIKITDGFFFGPYFGLNYNFLSFDKLNPNLKNNALCYSFGIVIKGTSRQKKHTFN